MNTAHHDPFDLHQAIHEMRWQLGTELLLRLLLYAVGAGLVAAALTRSLASALALDVPIAITVGALLLPLIAALAITAICWPSAMQAARAVDRRFGLHERLSTALELMQHPESLRRARLAWLQVRDAAQAAAEVSRHWPPLVDRVRREILISLGSALLAAALLLLPRLGLGELAALLPWSHPAQPELAQTGMVAPELDVMEQPVGMLPESQMGELHTIDPAAAQAAEHAAAQRRALDRLAQALREVSVGQAAAQAIQQGNYQAAASELAQLGENADQLSPEAKERLAAALQEAARDPSSQGSRLAELEQRAAEALAGSDYEAQRRALEELAQEVARLGPSATAAAGDPPDELSEQLPTSGGTESSGNPGSMEGASGAGGERWQDGRATAGGTEGGSGTGSSGQADSTIGPQPGGIKQGQQAGGEQADGGGERPAMNLDHTTPRLETSGTPVEVPAQLTLGSGESLPAGEHAQPALSVNSPVAAAAGTGGDTPVVTPLPPEQNLVPGDRRRLIQEYFNGEGHESSP